MFSRASRLSRADFASAGFAQGKKRTSTHFSALFPTESTGYAVIISKKTVKSSVKRHLLKRRILAALRAFPLPKALVVYPRAKALELPHKELAAELKDLVSK